MARISTEPFGQIEPGKRWCMKCWRAGCENDRVERHLGAPNHTCSAQVCIDAYRNYTRPLRATEEGIAGIRPLLTSSRIDQPGHERSRLA